MHYETKVWICSIETMLSRGDIAEVLVHLPEASITSRLSPPCTLAPCPPLLSPVLDTYATLRDTTTDLQTRALDEHLE